MQLYHGFKDEVKNHGNPEMHKALLAIMLEVVKDKPSLTMSQYDHGSNGILSQLFSKKTESNTISEE